GLGRRQGEIGRALRLHSGLERCEPGGFSDHPDVRLMPDRDQALLLGPFQVDLRRLTQYHLAARDRIEDLSHDPPASGIVALTLQRLTSDQERYRRLARVNKERLQDPAGKCSAACRHIDGNDPDEGAVDADRYDRQRAQPPPEAAHGILVRRVVAEEVAYF